MLRRIYLLTYMVAAAAIIPVALTFNIDTTAQDVYSGEQKDFFGYKVLQFTSHGNKGIIVTAPLRLNGSGGVFRQDQQQTKWFNPNVSESSLPNEAVVKHLGLSIAADSTGSQITVCSPSVAHECHNNSYLNSICYNINDQFEQISPFMTAFQECTEKTVDLVFLFDGSLSMTTKEFEKNKFFIKDIMNNLKNTSIKFAAAQFSSTSRTVFDFNDYVAGRADDKLKREPHMKDLTNTYEALEFVLEKFFQNPNAGATPDATKVVVLITDGDPSDFDRNNITSTYDKKNIIRFVIGVKDAKLDKFQDIASEPKDKYAFKIENYDGLTGILENFQINIFNIEGTKAALAGNLTNEMSQSGFSAAFYEDTLILGSVGSNSWSGSLQEIQRNKEAEIKVPEMQMDSYMGYSVSVGKKNGAPLYFSGAPRFEHTGRVILFTNQSGNWTTAQTIDGDQIGSYFGAELCSVDVDSDGETDFLLVGAPLFFQSQEKKEGRIYIYKLTDKMELESKLNVMAPSIGRFGTTISILADLNGDGLRDVAVGAPLEDDNRGVVYMYLGDRHKGIRKDFSQRIKGARIRPGIRFFGQAINGDIDLGDDNLPDIVVGSQGTAVVLRSKPIFNVSAHLSFQPDEISPEELNCFGGDENLPMVTLTACFQMVEATKSRAGAASSKLNISYTIDVDPRRPISRGFFSDKKDKKARNLTTTFNLEDKELCFNHFIYIQKCVTDTLSPVSIKLEFSQPDNESATAILNMDSKTQSDVEVPFERQCRKNDTCIAELEVDFNFMTPTLFVAEDNFFNVSVKLVNNGDDSYDTSLTINYPPGLSFSWMTLIEASRPTLHSCNGLEGVLDKTTCGVSLPVYRSRSSATFKIDFRIMNDYEWNDTISMTIAATSENTNSTRPISKSIQVQYEIKMALTVSEDTITYLNFTTEDVAPKKILTIYRIDNTGFKDFPVNVSLFFPTKLKYGFKMNNYQVFVQQNKSECTSSTDFKSEHCLPENNCKAVVCNSFILEKNSAVEFRLLGDVHFKDLQQQAENIAFLKKYTGESAKVDFTSFIRVDYEKERYVLDSAKQDTKDKPHETGLNNPTMTSSKVSVEFTIFPNRLLIILTGVGLGFLLLIIITVIMFKMGCFKRKMHQYCQELEEEASLQDGTATNGTISKSKPDDEADQPPEEKKLLEAGEQEEESKKQETKV